MGSLTRRTVVRRSLARVARPFRAVWRFGHWVGHSKEDTDAVYGPNPTDLTPEGRVAKAAVIASGLGAGGGGGR